MLISPNFLITPLTILEEFNKLATQIKCDQSIEYISTFFVQSDLLQASFLNLSLQTTLYKRGVTFAKAIRDPQSTIKLKQYTITVDD